MRKSAEILSVSSGVVAAILASACCVIPLILVLLGVGGSWVSALSYLEPWRPLFIVVVLAAFSYAGYLVFRPGTDCEAGDACQTRIAAPGLRRLYWIALGLSMILTTGPYWIPWLF